MKNDEIEFLTETASDEENKISEKYKAVKKKIKIKKNIFVLSISLLVIFIITITSFIVIRYYKKLNEVTIKDYELYQYFAGYKYEYVGELSLKRNGEITKLNYKDIEIETDSTPIYFKNIDNEMILPTNMGLYILRLVDKNYKLPYFSRIYVEGSENESSSFLLAENNKKVFLDKSILFDGNNLYSFLVETTVVIDGESIVLSPLSYIIVNYKSEINIYDKKTDQFRIIETHNDDVIAIIDSFKVNLSTDSILYNNNSKLLIRNVDNLTTYK